MLKFAFVSPSLCNFGQLVAPHLNKIFIWGSLISNYSMCPYKSNHYVLKNRKQASFCDFFLIIWIIIILPKYFFLHFICVRFKIVFYFFFLLFWVLRGVGFFKTLSFIRNFKMDLKAKKSYDLEKKMHEIMNIPFLWYSVAFSFTLKFKCLLPPSNIVHATVI